MAPRRASFILLSALLLFCSAAIATGEDRRARHEIEHREGFERRECNERRHYGRENEETRPRRARRDDFELAPRDEEERMGSRRFTEDEERRYGERRGRQDELEREHERRIRGEFGRERGHREWDAISREERERRQRGYGGENDAEVASRREEESKELARRQERERFGGRPYAGREERDEVSRRREREWLGRGADSCNEEYPASRREEGPRRERRIGNERREGSRHMLA